MISDEAFVRIGIKDLVAHFKTGTLSPDEACWRYLARIDRMNPQARSVVHVDYAGAMAAAQASAQRWKDNRPLSPLDGVPVLAKSNIAIKDMPWHAGIYAYHDRFAKDDAPVIDKLRTLGIVFLGLTNMHEAALGATTDNPWYGRTQNPLKAGYTAGGSSGGSAAAVASGFCAAALGTDTLGSVRVPSSYCGIAGFKPSGRKVSRKGVVPLSRTLDQVGFHTRHWMDLPLLVQPFDPAPDKPATAKRGLKIGVLEDVRPITLTPDVSETWAKMLDQIRGLGLSLTPITLEQLDPSRLRRRALLVCEVEAIKAHRMALKRRPAGFSEELRAMLDWGNAQSEDKVSAAYLALKEAKQHIRALLKGFDALITPTTPQAAFSFDDPVPENQADFTSLASIADLPALTVPMAQRPDIMPTGIQIIARRSHTVFAAAACLFPATP